MNTVKSVTDVDQLFKVPNNAEGRFFLLLIKRYAAPGISTRSRGRKPNREKAIKAGYKNFHFSDSVPQEIADELGIYLRMKGEKRDINIGMAAAREYPRLQRENWKLTMANEQLTRTKGQLIDLTKRLTGIVGEITHHQKDYSES
jgi:hypothetical protein